MQIALEVTIRKGDSVRQWTSPCFDTDSPSASVNVLPPVQELLDVSSDADVRFRLVGDPRVQSDQSWATAFKINGYQGNEPALTFNNRGVFEYQGESTVKYFINTWRTTWLRFHRMTEPDVQIFEVPVTVVDCSGRGMMYLKMLRDVLSVNPGLALPEDNRMFVPRLFDLVFSECQNGDTDINWDLFEYEKLHDDLELLVFGHNPLLRTIELNPVVGQKIGERYMPFGKVRHITTRQINALEYRGVDYHDPCADQYAVAEEVFLEDSHGLANRAIKTFLEEALRALERLERKFARQHKLYQLAHHANHKTESQHCNQRIKSAFEKARQVKMDSQHLRRYVESNKLWRSLTGNVRLRDCRYDIFSSRPDYLRVYGVIYRYYMRKHWLPTYEGDCFTLSYDVKEKPVSNGLQRSFNFMYEAWVFVRLLKAFSRNGFNLGLAYSKMLCRMDDVFMGLDANESVVAVANDGKIGVRLTYGVVEKYSDKPLTPDFSVEFENMESHQKHVIIMDAKTSVSWNPKAMEKAADKRDRYLQMHWEAPQNFPNQSWLVYNGDSDSTAAIEFAHDEGLRLDSNIGLKWEGENGITGAWGLNTRPVGYLRVNSNSVEDYDVFNEFVAGQIATARRHI